jgi:hypothetical protein
MTDLYIDVSIAALALTCAQQLTPQLTNNVLGLAEVNLL